MKQLLPTAAPTQSLGALARYEVSGRTLTVHSTEGARLEIAVLAPDMVRVHMIPAGTAPPTKSFAVSASPEQWPDCAVDVEETGDGLTLQARFDGAAAPSGVTVGIAGATLRLTIRDEKGRIAAACSPEGGLTYRTVGAASAAGVVPSPADTSHADTSAPDVAIDGTILSAEAGALPADASTVQGGLIGPADPMSRWDLQAPADARYYGFGQKQGFLDKRGQRMSLWATDEPLHILDHDELYQAIPFFLTMGADGHSTGVFVDCPARVTYDVAKAKTDVCSIELAVPTLDAYVFTGPDAKDVIRRYTDLTGRMELPPLWALGYQQCRYSYYPESRVREIAREMREREIPCDAIYLDIHYMDGYRVFTWDKDRFPNPKQMVADLAEDGFKTITIVDPGVKVDGRYEVFQDGIRNDHFVCHPDGELFIGTVWPGRTAFPDFMREETRRWWGDLHRGLINDVGIAAIWNDMNEPSCFARNTFPDEILQGEEGEQVRHADVHNVYGQTMAVATHDALKRLQPDKRPFLLTRSGYAGIQKYAAVWMGDNHSWWEHLHMAMPMCLGMGMSGVPFVGTDIGGFQRDSNGELFARWIQMGALMPFSRNHSALDTIDQEPWSFGPEVEDIAREFLRLRYRMLPFLYNEFYNSTKTGLPIMRPLVLEYPTDSHTFNLGDQFLLGTDVLVCPVYQPGVTKRMVYLPAGDWFDFWSGKRLEGGQHIVADAPLERMPLYVRGGAIVPMEHPVNHTGERDGKELILHAYASEDGQLELYEDAGEGFGYVRGEFAVTTVAVKREGNALTFAVSDPEVSGEPDSRAAYTEAREREVSIPRGVDAVGGFQPPREEVTVHLYVGEGVAAQAIAEERVTVRYEAGGTGAGDAAPEASVSVGSLGELVVNVATPNASGFTVTVDV